MTIEGSASSESTNFQMRDTCGIQRGVVELPTFKKTMFSVIEAVGIP